jgi:uncharacterized membrane protein
MSRSRYAPSMGSRTASQITVGRPKGDVMAIIADFPGYPQWAGALKSADVLATGPGGRASKVRFTLDAGLLRDDYVLAYSWDGDARVSWELAEGGSVISELAGSYDLTDRDVGTEVSYELTVGLRVPMPGLVRRTAEKMIIDAALKGLKARAESLADGAKGDIR